MMRFVIFAIAVISAASAECVPNGGMLQKKGTGTIGLINVQQRIRSAAFSSDAREIFAAYRLGFNVFEAERFSFGGASKVMDDCKVNAAVFVVDDASLPMTLVAEESRWGLVNVAAVVSDAPNENLLARRIEKLVARTFVNVLGASYSPAKTSVMRSVLTLADLDSIKNTEFEPSYVLNLMMYSQTLGVTPSKMVSYERACEEGWAPDPTNAVQREIWDDVHAVPSAPIKIKYRKK